MSRRRRHGRQAGYILILNIGVLALLLLGATYMGRQMNVALTMARTEQQVLLSEQQIADAQARLLFTLAVWPRTADGLGVGAQAIVPDGRLYRLDDQVAVRIQDTRGLIGLNAVPTPVWRQLIERLLGTYGLDADTTARLVDALLDYRDADNLRRLNGAEEEEYRATGKAHWLRNADLLVPGELARVHGWAEIAALWGEDPITDHVSAATKLLLNPNTATPRVLAAFSGLPAEVLKDLMASKRRGELVDLTPFVNADVGDPFTRGMAFVRIPADLLQLDFFTRQGPLGRRITVVHWPASEQAPWRIESAEKIARAPRPEKWTELPLLPDAGQLPAISLPDRIQLPL